MTATNNVTDVLTHIFNNYSQQYENKENFNDR